MQAYQFAFVHLRLPSTSPVGGDKRKRHKEAVKTVGLLYFKLRTTPPIQALTFTYSHTELSFFSWAHSHVRHSEPAVKLIASTSFQGHTITPSSPALLHEYIEERFPATLFHDWIPKDKRKKEKKKRGKWKGRGGKQEQGVFYGLVRWKCNIIQIWITQIWKYSNLVYIHCKHTCICKHLSSLASVRHVRKSVKVTDIRS